VWSVAGTVVIAELPGQLTGSSTGRVALALLTVGLLLKVPVVPLHFWLPAAHTLAPSAVSPLLSALVVKSAFVVLLRLWITGVPELTATAVAPLVGALGAVAMVWGGLAALRASRVKVVVAYSTVAQLGLLLLAVPMVVDGSAEAWVGGVVHAIAHALPKAALLMAVAVLAHQPGRRHRRPPGGGRHPPPDRRVRDRHRRREPGRAAADGRLRREVVPGRREHLHGAVVVGSHHRRRQPADGRLPRAAAAAQLRGGAGTPRAPRPRGRSADVSP
jgi:hypothetical protein